MAIVLATMPALAAAEMASQVNVPMVFHLKAFVNVAEPRLYLGDIAECTGLAELCAQSLAVDIGASPAPGVDLLVAKTSLSSILATEFPGAAIELVGADTVQVLADSQQLEAEQIKDALLRTVSSLLPDLERYRVEISSLRLLNHVRTRTGAVLIRFPLLEHPVAKSLPWLLREFRGATKIDGVVQDKAGEGTEFVVYGNVKISQQLPLAMLELKRGDLIKAKDFALGWKVIRANATDFVDKVEAVQGFELKRGTRPGEPISYSQVARPVDVKRGQIVRLSSQNAGVTVSSEARSLGNGSIGETIEVEQIATKKKLRATVTSKHEAQVQF